MGGLPGGRRVVTRGVDDAFVVAWDDDTVVDFDPLVAFRRFRPPLPISWLMSLFSAVLTGCVALKRPMLAFRIGLGVAARLAVRTGCATFRTTLGVAFRTLFLTIFFAKPTASLPS